MKSVTQKLFVLSALIASTVLPATAFALPMNRTDITIFDGDAGNGGAGDARGVFEDGETEPGMVNSQTWDMESVFQYGGGSKLGMISGFNFKNGYGGFTAGDIFIDTKGTHLPGSAQTGVNGYRIESYANFGYDFVIDVDWTSIDANGVGSYKVVLMDDANDDALVSKPWYKQNYGSGPFEYISGGTVITTGSFMFESGLSDAQTGFAGGNHYAAYGFDLGFLGQYDEFWVSNAMGCGNDHLLGHGAPASVAEPSSLVLLGLGLMGLGYLRKRV